MSGSIKKRARKTRSSEEVESKRRQWVESTWDDAVRQNEWWRDLKEKIQELVHFYPDADALLIDENDILAIRVARRSGIAYTSKEEVERASRMSWRSYFQKNK